MTNAFSEDGATHEVMLRHESSFADPAEQLQAITQQVTDATSIVINGVNQPPEVYEQIEHMFRQMADAARARAEYVRSIGSVAQARLIMPVLSTEIQGNTQNLVDTTVINGSATNGQSKTDPQLLPVVANADTVEVLDGKVEVMQAELLDPTPAEPSPQDAAITESVVIEMEQASTEIPTTEQSLGAAALIESVAVPAAREANPEPLFTIEDLAAMPSDARFIITGSNGEKRLGDLIDAAIVVLLQESKENEDGQGRGYFLNGGLTLIGSEYINQAFSKRIARFLHAYPEDIAMIGRGPATRYRINPGADVSLVKVENVRDANNITPLPKIGFSIKNLDKRLHQISMRGRRSTPTINKEQRRMTTETPVLVETNEVGQSESVNDSRPPQPKPAAQPNTIVRIAETNAEKLARPLTLTSWGLELGTKVTDDQVEAFLFVDGNAIAEVDHHDALLVALLCAHNTSVKVSNLIELCDQLEFETTEEIIAERLARLKNIFEANAETMNKLLKSRIVDDYLYKISGVTTRGVEVLRALNYPKERIDAFLALGRRM